MYSGPPMLLEDYRNHTQVLAKVVPVLALPA